MANSTPSKAERNWPSVIVAGASQTGVVLMRDLARCGVCVACVDCHPEGAGFHTVYGPGFICPNPDEHPCGWLDFMIAFAKKRGDKPVLMASADQFVSAIARHSDELERYFVFYKSAIAVQSVLATKEEQYDFANRHGMPVSRTQFVTSPDDVAKFGAAACFPCLIKPLHARLWEAAPTNHPLRGATVCLVNSADDLMNKYHLAAEIDAKVVVQEVIEGPDTAKVVYLSCYGQGGRRLGSGVVRELRTFPAHFGAASVVEPVVDEETDIVCDRFLQSVNYAGLCEIELKRDSRDGKLRMIEANPRYSVTADAATYGGVVLGWLHYLDLIGQPVVPVRFDGRAFRHICLMRDFRTIDTYLREGLLTWRSLLNSYRGTVGFYDFDLKDWRVTAKTVRSLARVVGARLYRRFIPKKRRETQLPS